MSFSSEVKEELSRHLPTARHCQIAETAAILSLCGQISEKGRDDTDFRQRMRMWQESTLLY